MRKPKNTCRLVDAFRIYPASNLKHRSLWQRLQQKGHPIEAVWLGVEKLRQKDAVAPEIKEAIAQTSGLMWEGLIHDVQSSNGVLMYQEPGDTNGGALIEVGAALAMDLPVFYVGHAYGEKGMSFLNHPRVERFFTLEEALEAIDKHAHKVLMNEGRDIVSPVAGAPFALDSEVRVVRAIDRQAHNVSGYIGRVGTVVGYNYGGVGQHYPNDPLVRVRFGGRTSEVFWPEELVACPT